MNKTDGKAMGFVGAMSGCDVCTILKSTQRAHPNTDSINVNNEENRNDCSNTVNVNDNSVDVLYSHHEILFRDTRDYTPYLDLSNAYDSEDRPAC